MKFAFVFPGQGSQSVGMMQGFSDNPTVRDVFSRASDILGTDLWTMVAEGPADVLNATINTQPAMLTAGVAIYHAWRDSGGDLPVAFAGHSLGEYTALVAAEALSLEDALPLVRFRAEAMQQAVAEGEGSMAAVLGLDDGVVKEVCAEAAQGRVLEAVNFNSPGQVVIAGHRDAVERGAALAKERGAKRAIVLPVSVPSHCALMKPAADKLAVYLDNVSLSVPRTPVIHNADVTAYDDISAIKGALVRQLHSPVRWVETLQRLANQPVQAIVECGPGKVLAGLTKRTCDNLDNFALTDLATLEQAKSALQ